MAVNNLKEVEKALAATRITLLRTSVFSAS